MSEEYSAMTRYVSQTEILSLSSQVSRKNPFPAH